MKRIIFTFLFSLFIFFPSSYFFIKIVFGGFLFFTFFMDMIVEKNIIKKNIILVYLYLMVFGLLVSLISIFNSNHVNYLVGVRLLFFSVVFYFVFALFLRSDKERFSWLIDALYFSSLLISLNIVFYISFKLLGVVYPLEFLDLDYKFGRSVSGLFAYSTNNLPVLMFTIPFMIFFSSFNGRNDNISYFIILITLISAFLSLRNAVIFVSLISVLTVLLMKRKYFIALSSVAISIVLVFLIAVFFPDLWETYINLKLRAVFSGDDIRYLQFLFWIDLILESPFFGHGLGSVAPAGGNIINPHGYELTYLMFVAQVGMIPSVIYFIFSLYILKNLFLKSMKLHKSGLYFEFSLFLAMGLAMLMFLLASSSNGYLMTLGYLWTIFIPLTVLLSLGSKNSRLNLLEIK